MSEEDEDLGNDMVARRIVIKRSRWDRIALMAKSLSEHRGILAVPAEVAAIVLDAGLEILDEDGTVKETTDWPVYCEGCGESVAYALREPAKKAVCASCHKEAEERIEKLEKDLAECRPRSRGRRPSPPTEVEAALEAALGAVVDLVGRASRLMLGQGVDPIDVRLLQEGAAQGLDEEALAEFRKACALALDEHLSDGGSLFHPRRDALREHNARFQSSKVHLGPMRFEGLFQSPCRAPVGNLVYSTDLAAVSCESCRAHLHEARPDEVLPLAPAAKPPRKSRAKK